jgi:hypothetical protein
MRAGVSKHRTVAWTHHIVVRQDHTPSA